ncbi:MAG: hypothetical protein WKF41_01900 [Gaiellaceae bacterium]
MNKPFCGRLGTSLQMHYSAREMAVQDKQQAVVEHLSRYLDKLFTRVESRVEARVVERVEATIDVLSDPALLDDLRRADKQPDEEARPFNEIARDLGRASA